MAAARPPVRSTASATAARAPRADGRPRTTPAAPERLRAAPLVLGFGAGGIDHRNLSGAAMDERHLWVVGDEASVIERFDIVAVAPRGAAPGGSNARRAAPGARGPAAGFALRHGGSFDLAALLDLPDPGADAGAGGSGAAAAPEADLEGLALADGYLWLLGSHSLKRGRAVGDGRHADDARKLATVKRDGNRLLLARVPLHTGADGAQVPMAQTPDGRRAARLRGDGTSNPLLALLERDAHVGPFAALPGKDNGLDIEGIAVHGERVLLGLRGPVLRGWACVLELRVRQGARRLKLAPPAGGSDGAGGEATARDDDADADGNVDIALVRKHFLPLDGLGVRDLHLEGDDLVLLAGPTMALDGDIRLYRWAGALRSLRAVRHASHFVPAVEHLATLPHGRGTDRAEAVARVPAAWAGRARRWVVLYDAPGPARLPRPGCVVADVVTA